MAGNSNSGRRPLSVEMKRKAIIDKAWDRCERLIDSPGKMGDIVAKDIAIKDQTTKIDADVHAEVIHMPMIEKDSKPMEHQVGS